MNNYWKDKPILITGAAGFIGSNAVECLLKQGAVITATISPNTSEEEIQKKLGENSKKIRLLRVDLNVQKDVNKITNKIAVILNFAAVDGGMGFKRDHSLKIYEENTSITRNLLKAALHSNVKNFLLLSSSDVYDIEGKQLITEEMAGNPKWSHKVDGYKLAKWESEQEAIKLSRDTNLGITIVRPSNVYGPKDNFENESKIRFIPAIIRNIYLSEKPITIWGDGSQLKSFLYVVDFLRISASLIEKNIINTPINVASQNYVTLKEVAEKIVALSNIDKKIQVDPSKGSGPKKRMIDTTLLQSKIGEVKETELDAGLKKTLEYFMSTN